MTRKLIIAIITGFGLMVASVSQLPATIQFRYQQQVEEVPNEVLILPKAGREKDCEFFLRFELVSDGQFENYQGGNRGLCSRNWKP